MGAQSALSIGIRGENENSGEMLDSEQFTLLYTGRTAWWVGADEQNQTKWAGTPCCTQRSTHCPQREAVQQGGRDGWGQKGRQVSC